MAGEVPDPPWVADLRARGVFTTTPTERLTRRDRAWSAAHLPVLDAPPRPRTRADCVDGPRPCPWLGCRFHVDLDVNPSGSVSLRDPVTAPAEPSCTLDVAARGGVAPVELAKILGLTRQGADVAVRGALARLRRLHPGLHGDE